AAADRALAGQGAAAAVRWAVDTVGTAALCLTASMTDAVLIDVATRVEPAIEVVFIDTGLNFPETLETAEAVRRRYGLNLRVVRVPEPAVPFHLADPVACCSVAKVAALDEALAGKRAWLSGLRRVETTTRAGAPIVGRDSRGLLKVNPLAAWTDADVSAYIAAHDVPVNPLVARGYASIGCAPCTGPVAAGGGARSGRWDGVKTECGLHDRLTTAAADGVTR
ncbi:MAG: phosphoadenylyl-sulfate reductase, partial [Acidimicrobiales bacterium]